MDDMLKKLRAATKDLDTNEFLAWAFRKWGDNIVFSSSMGSEDQVLFDILNNINPELAVFTLDTGRLHQETYDTIVATEKKYKKKIELVFPETSDLQELYQNNNINMFFDSFGQRKSCCRVRKVLPLQKKLKNYKAWITGQRQAQSNSRSSVERLEYDEQFGLFKINPLCAWTSAEIWNFIRTRNIPYNTLHDKAYPSIGCMPCTRAIKPGEDERAGRWWWELEEQKECGIHIENGKLIRTGQS